MPEDRKPGRILFVEDDKFMVRMYEVRLAAEGFSVETAMNGDECLDKVLSSAPDIVLLDLTLPLMNGFKVLETLKADKRTSSIPVVVFSNRSSPEDIAHAKELGAVDFLVKVSTPPEEVIRTINNAISRTTEKPRKPYVYQISIDWNAFDAKQMAEDLGIPVEYRGGKCITEMYLEAMPEYSHDDPWITGHFIAKKKSTK